MKETLRKMVLRDFEEDCLDVEKLVDCNKFHNAREHLDILSFCCKILNLCKWSQLHNLQKRLGEIQSTLTNKKETVLEQLEDISLETLV